MKYLSRDRLLWFGHLAQAGQATGMIFTWEVLGNFEYELDKYNMSLTTVIGLALFCSGAFYLLEAWTDGAVLLHRWRWNWLRKRFGASAVRWIFAANGLVLIAAGFVMIRM